MAIGIVPSLAQLNQLAGQNALAFRNATQAVVEFNSYIQGLGEAGLMAAPYSMAQVDADNLLSIYNNLAQVCQALLGNNYAGPALPFPFLGNAVPLLGGN